MKLCHCIPNTLPTPLWQKWTGVGSLLLTGDGFAVCSATVSLPAAYYEYERQEISGGQSFTLRDWVRIDAATVVLTFLVTGVSAYAVIGNPQRVSGAPRFIQQTHGETRWRATGHSERVELNELGQSRIVRREFTREQILYSATEQPNNFLVYTPEIIGDQCTVDSIAMRLKVQGCRYNGQTDWVPFTAAAVRPNVDEYPRQAQEAPVFTSTFSIPAQLFNGETISPNYTHTFIVSKFVQVSPIS